MITWAIAYVDEKHNSFAGFAYAFSIMADIAIVWIIFGQ